MIVRFASLILTLEPLLLALTVFAFWFPDPRRLWSLLLLPLIFAARYILYRRFWTPTPLDVVLGVFLALCALNVFVAPFTRGWLMLGRPIMGMVLAIGVLESARRTRQMDGVLRGTLGLALLISVVALTSSQWSNKSTSLRLFIDLLPDLYSLPVITGGFNVNEIAGAMAWVIPIVAAVAIYDWRSPLRPRRRLTASLTFCLLMVALFFGQSRSAIIGVILALGLLIFALIPPGRWRKAAIVALALLTLLELLILFGRFADAGNTNRDELSVGGRVMMWQSALEMVRDYPLTGVGMSMYRAPVVHSLYPVPSVSSRVRVHAHNELLQVSTDLGIPGTLVFIGWHIVLGWMLLQSWRYGDAYAKTVAVGCAGGLLAHGVFGMADAITLWDRFTFVYWWIVGLSAAQFMLVRRSLQNAEAEKSSLSTAPLDVDRGKGYSSR
jgi:hypothetical protein